MRQSNVHGARWLLRVGSTTMKRCFIVPSSSRYRNVELSTFFTHDLFAREMASDMNIHDAKDMNHYLIILVLFLICVKFSL